MHRRFVKRWRNSLRRRLNYDALQNRRSTRRQPISITSGFSCDSWTHSDARSNMLDASLSRLRIKARSIFRRLFHLLLDRLQIRRLREHSFFGSLLPEAAIVADFGAHRGEFFKALKSQFSISRALLVEANPALAESLKRTFVDTRVLHAALVGRNNGGPVSFTRSTNPESSSIFREWSEAHGIADQVKV